MKNVKNEEKKADISFRQEARFTENKGCVPILGAWPYLC